MSTVLLGLPGGTGFAVTGDYDRAHAQIVQGVLGAILAAAAIGCNGARRAPGSLLDPRDRRGDFDAIGHDPVVVVADPGPVAEFDRSAEAVLGDRAGIWL